MTPGEMREEARQLTGFCNADAATWIDRARKVLSQVANAPVDSLTEAALTPEREARNDVVDDASTRREAIADERAKVATWLRSLGILEFKRVDQILEAFERGEHLRATDERSYTPTKAAAEGCGKAPQAAACRCK